VNTYRPTAIRLDPVSTVSQPEGTFSREVASEFLR
jgi:hypothetical protein